MNSPELEKVIMTLMLNDNDFSSKVIPYFNPEYFSVEPLKNVARLFKRYTDEYNALPSEAALRIELEQQTGITQETFKDASVAITDLYSDKFINVAKSADKSHIITNTEKYFRLQSCYIAMMKSLDILDSNKKGKELDEIPEILKEAISISFDTNIGHDYITDAESRFESYHNVERTLPFRLTALNLITHGGAGFKSLIVPVAPTGVGKSFFMTDWSAYLLQNGYNVLYVTLELSEEKIAERIDMNLMDITKQDLLKLPPSTFRNKIAHIKSNPIGRIKIKEYVSGVFHANHLRHLLKELKLKENFEPDIVMVDYLNLMASYREPTKGDSYSYFKSVSEELRGVAMEYGIIACSPTQTNRDAINQPDFTLSQISESMGVAHTADLMFGLIQTEEMAKNNQIRIKQLKNRWGDITRPTSFMINVDKSKMQMFNGDDISMYFRDNHDMVNNVNSLQQSTNPLMPNMATLSIEKPKPKLTLNYDE